MADVNNLIQQAQNAQAQGNNSKALDYFHQALLQHPDEVSLQATCGNLCVQLGKYEEAAGHFRRILLFNKSPEVRNALCYALQALGNEADNSQQYALAEACFEEALSHQPNHAGYWYNLGNAQRELGKLTAAVTSFQQSIQADPNNADAYNNLGNVQRELGQLDVAINHYRQALKLNPNLHHALAHLIHQKQHVCEWQSTENEDLAQQIQTARALVCSTPAAQISPFAFLAMPSTTAEEQKQCANHYVAQNYQQLIQLRDTLSFSRQTNNKQKLHIAYLSADFRLHPLAFLITSLIEHHDRSRVEVSAYSYGASDDTDTRKRLIKAFDHFTDIRMLNDVDAASQINQDQVDILIDLTGYTQSSRTGIVALRPAAIHISWLGFPGTMGSYQGQSLFDYIIADETTAPRAEDFTEQVMYLPCYQPNSPRDMAAESSKASHQLPNDSFIFCSFNQTFKITPAIFAIWMRLLKAEPASVLWLLDCNQWAKSNLQKEATHADIDPSRLIFAPRVTAAEHIERQRHADLFIDTLPYNAHTTASDALWAGLPVLTYQGDTFAASVAASILKQAKLPDLICSSLAEYEEKALHYATHPDDLVAIKKQLNDTIKTSNLFNSEKFARLLETQYHEAWQRFTANTP